MVKEIFKRWNLPMSSFWKKFQRICIALAVVIPSTGELAEYMSFLPEGFIPVWFKSIIGIMILLGILIPKLTVDETKKDA